MGTTGGIRTSSALLAGAISPVERTREEVAEVFFFVLCALLAFLVGPFLFTFFNGDVVDLYSRRIDVARVTRRNGHQDIQSLHHLTKDTVFVIQMRGGNVSDKELRAVCVGS